MQGSPKGTTGETLTVEPSVEAWRPPPLDTDESQTRGGGDCLDIASFRRVTGTIGRSPFPRTGSGVVGVPQRQCIIWVNMKES